MKMKIIFIIIILVVSQVVNAQYNLLWYSIYDNPHPSYNDIAVDLVEDSFGNTFVTGTSFQIGLTEDWRYDFATVKYNSVGDSVWVRRYNSLSEDDAVAIGIDSQNNVYVTGNTYSSSIRVSTLKYDANGNQIWVKVYADSILSPNINVNDMKVDKYGNVFLVCSDYTYYSRAGEIIKYNTNGNIEWISKYYRGADDVNSLISIDLDSQGNIYATGFTKDSGSASSDFLTVKYDQYGVLQWAARTDQTSEDIAHCIHTDDFGNVYIAGYSKAQGNLYDFNIIKYNSNGIKQWTGSYAGRADIDEFNNYSRKKMIAEDKSGNIYVNFISNTSGNNDIATAKFSSSGEMKWIDLYDIITIDNASDIRTDNSNNVYVTGFSKYDQSVNSFVILEYDSAGTIQNIIKNDNQFPNVFSPVAMSVNNNGDITAAGTCLQEGNPYATDYFTVRYSTSVGINTNSNSAPADFKLYQNYPNPFNPSTKIKYEVPENGNITLKVFDVLGKEISVLVNEKQNAGNYEVNFDGNNLPGGVYFYKLESYKFSVTMKFIILK